MAGENVNATQIQEALRGSLKLREMFLEVLEDVGPAEDPRERVKELLDELDG